MSNKKYCEQCLECCDIESKVYSKDNGNHCKECIRKYDLWRCNHCGKYKSKSLMNINEETCITCLREVRRICQNCEKSKALILFLADTQYCGECQYLMERKCIHCGKKQLYYTLDNGEYCIECQQNKLKICKGCNGDFKYSNFYYCKSRLYCKKCITKYRIESHKLLVKYEPVGMNKN